MVNMTPAQRDAMFDPNRNAKADVELEWTRAGKLFPGQRFLDAKGDEWAVRVMGETCVYARPVGSHALADVDKVFEDSAEVRVRRGGPHVGPTGPAPGPEEAACGCGQPHGAPAPETGLPAFVGGATPSYCTTAGTLPVGAWFQFWAQGKVVHEVTGRDEPEALLPVTVHHRPVENTSGTIHSCAGSAPVLQLTLAPARLADLPWKARFTDLDRRVYEKSHETGGLSSGRRFFCSRVAANGVAWGGGNEFGADTVVRPLAPAHPMSKAPAPPPARPAPKAAKARLFAALYGMKLEPDCVPPFTHLLGHELDWIEDQSKADADIASRDALHCQASGDMGREQLAKSMADYHAMTARVYEVKAERALRGEEPNPVKAAAYRGRAQVERELARHYASKGGAQ